MISVKVTYHRTDSLKAAPFNPCIRVERKRLSDLLQSMRKHGFLAHHPILITSDKTIADGHRRWTCAQLLGIDEVPCIVIRTDLEAEWALNQTGRTPTSREMIIAVGQGLTEVIGRQAADIAAVRKWLGEKGLHFLAEHETSSRVLRFALQIARYCAHDEDADFVALTTYWLVNHKMQRFGRIAIEQGIPPDKLEERILADRPLSLWG